MEKNLYRFRMEIYSNSINIISVIFKIFIIYKINIMKYKITINGNNNKTAFIHGSNNAKIIKTVI